jgi:hypothetical protein
MYLNVRELIYFQLKKILMHLYSNIHACEDNLHDIMHCSQTYEYCYEDECYKNQGQE